MLVENKTISRLPVSSKTKCRCHFYVVPILVVAISTIALKVIIFDFIVI